MQNLSRIIFLLIGFLSFSFAQSPHGKDFKLDCENCHNNINWEINLDEVKFDHSSTNFELSGQHKSVNCIDCHESLVFNQAPTNCFECHTDIHETTLGNDCARCHEPQSWVVSNIIEIHELSRFPLLGAHRTADCYACHQTSSLLRFEPFEIECFVCHQQDYLNSQNPNHVQAGFPTDCLECHQLTDQTWTTQNISHDFFPLVQGHSIGDCFACHNQDSFSGLSQECYQCHSEDYSTTTNPNHIENSFPQNCETCHTLNPGWQPASFVNHDDIYPLIGAHNEIRNDCVQCHTTGYNNTPNLCFGCHESDYNNTLDPPHSTSNFSTECEECHNSTAWTPSTFDHDGQYFPIYSGEHFGEWDNCTDCHTNSTDFTFFSCTDCHEHNQTDMDEEHSGVNGYNYDSQSCYACHPNGSSEDSFNHSLTDFPLLDSHLFAECVDCHASGYQGTSTECSSCHLEDYNSSSDPNHQQLGLSTNCADCHSALPGWEPAQFPVHNEFFVIDGAHASVNDCSECHSSGYSNTPNLCFDCHTTDYNSAINPNHIELSISQQCEDCHTSAAGWEPAQFIIHDEFFVLDGAHSLIANDCFSCHEGQYTSTPNNCFNCHSDDFNNTQDPNHTSAGFSTDCETCHTTTAWEPATFDHDAQYFPIYSGEHNGEWVECSDCHTVQNNFSIFSCIDCHEHNRTDTDEEHQGVDGYIYQSTECFACHPTGSGDESFNHANSNFPLTGAHRIIDCFECHSNGYANTPIFCNECHNDDYTDSLNPNHTAAGLPQECETCHNTDAWTPSNFNHSSTGFELIGLHSSIQQCSDCHLGTTQNTPLICFECHNEEYNTAPEHVSQAYPTECEMCHSPVGWEETSFSHDNTDFPLTGSHVNVDCLVCHTSGYSGTPSLCKDCHSDDYSSAILPNHTEAGISLECETCHSTSVWKPSEFNHLTTGFELLGQHALIQQCSSCHVGSTSNTSAECFACHEDEYNSAPGHIDQRYPTTCEMCHNSQTWEETSFNHDDTQFPLTGSHINTDCSACHTTGYSGTSTICFDCHNSNYTSAANPNHQDAGIATTCETCHTTTLWNPSTFNHSTTGFELLGQHANIQQCSNCHEGSTSNTSPLCLACHETEYNSAPEHLAQQYPTTCEMCHNSNAWEETTFDHNTTEFPLTGQHTNVNCSDCHTNGYTNTPKDCNSCHNDNYTNTQNPNHSAAGISVDCESCHNTNGWVPSTFNHSTTGFELLGQHAIIQQCSSCHEGSTTNTSPLCFSCHEEEYNSAPEHLSQSFPTQCEMCHNFNSWEETSFDHDNTDFPLVGEHQNVECSECHSQGYSGTPTDCNSCHNDDFNNSLNPNHQALGLPLQCETCHTPAPNWEPALFPIHNDYFPLLGAHAAIADNCADCHNGDYNNTPNECIGCHQDDYNNSTNPPHASAQFPTTCEVCHNTNAWVPSTFNHDGQYFPIYSGKHQGEWNVCADCHTNANDYSIFSCIDCHEHNQADMDDEHSDVNGYVYQSEACYDCHPDGSDKLMLRLKNTFK
ncbi:MAG: hypothetical protein K8F36_11255 [Melioribacteraceae bacterium]|nr:hypothetical protein [Melioribacteraceae bacterium]